MISQSCCVCVTPCAHLLSTSVEIIGIGADLIIIFPGVLFMDAQCWFFVPRLCFYESIRLRIDLLVLKESSESVERIKVRK